MPNAHVLTSFLCNVRVWKVSDVHVKFLARAITAVFLTLKCEKGGVSFHTLNGGGDDASG
jgi:hypothetical protein